MARSAFGDGVHPSLFQNCYVQSIHFIALADHIIIKGAGWCDSLAVHDVIHPFEARTVILDAALDGALVFPFLRVALDGSFKNIKLVIDLYREEILIGMIGTVGKAVLKIICSVVGTLRLLNPERRTKVIGGNDFLILDFRLLLRRLRIRLG